MIALRKMTRGEYETWRATSIAGYAAEHVRAGNWSAEEAPEEAREAFEHYLPNGLDTERHYVCAIVAEPSGEKVGHLWYAVVSAAGGSATFIYDIGTDEPHRHKGFATAALKELEREAARLGTDSIRLHVFGSNTAARSLYAGLGYSETDIQMVKTLTEEAVSP
jgi:ribosomal protein S18 acetylase RimI-like enzyme